MFRLFTLVAVAVASLVGGETPAAEAKMLDGMHAELFRLTCEGHAHLAPSNKLLSMGMDLSHLVTAATEIKTVFEERGKCHCGVPATPDQVEYGFSPSIKSIFASMNKKGAPLSYDNCDNTFKGTFDNPIGDSSFAIVPGCSLQSWDSTGECKFEVNVTGMQAELQFFMSKCESSPFPFLSVTCNGARCHDFMKPCAASSDCDETVSKCHTMVKPDDAQSFYNGMQTMLENLKVWNVDKCAATKPNPGKDMTDMLLAEVARMFGRTVTTTGPGIKMCGGDIVDEGANFANRDVIRKGVCAYNEKCHVVSNPVPIPPIPTPSVSASPSTTTPSTIAAPIGCHAFDDALTLPAHCMCRCKKFIDIQADFFGGACPNVDDAITCPSKFREWDGTLKNGIKANSAERRAGTDLHQFHQAKPTLHTEKVPLFDVTCGRNMAFMSGSPVAFKGYTPYMHGMVDSVMNHMKSVLECHTPRISDEEYELDFLFTNLAMYLRAITHNMYAKPVSPIFGGTTLFDEMFSSTSNPGFVFPESCTVSGFLATGDCRMQFEGFKTLLDRDITIRIAIQKCSVTPFAPPSLSIDCVGLDCKRTMEPYHNAKPCVQDADCDTNHCLEIPAPDSDPYASFLWDTDTAATSTCTSPVTAKIDMARILWKVTGNGDLPSDAYSNVGVGQIVGFCSPFKRDLFDNADKWAEEQIDDSVEGQIRLVNMKPFRYFKGETDGANIKSLAAHLTLRFTSTLTPTAKAKILAALAAALKVPAARLSLSEPVVNASGAGFSVELTVTPAVGADLHKQASPKDLVVEAGRQMTDPDAPLSSELANNAIVADASAEYSVRFDTSDDTSGVSSSMPAVWSLVLALVASLFVTKL